MLTLNVSPGNAKVLSGLNEILGYICADVFGRKNAVNVVDNRIVNKKKMVVGFVNWRFGFNAFTVLGVSSFTLWFVNFSDRDESNYSRY